MMHSKIAAPARTLTGELANQLVDLQMIADDGDAFLTIAEDMIHKHVLRERKHGCFVGDEWRLIAAALRGAAVKFSEIENVAKEFEAVWFPDSTPADGP